MPEAAAKSTASHDAIGPRGKYARSDGTRARILQAALTEAGESGFQKTSVAKIAVRAGVAVGVVNYHFGSKGELLRELMASLTRDLHSRLYKRPLEIAVGLVGPGEQVWHRFVTCFPRRLQTGVTG